MIRTTITLDEELAAEIDQHIGRSGVANRSEAIRDLVRRGLSALPTEEPAASCIGVVTCSVDQTMPGLSRRLRAARMDRHAEIVFGASLPVNHHETLDISVFRTTVGRVDDYARRMFAERGIRHGAVALMPVTVETLHHAHDEGEEPHSHTHLRVNQSF